jgi:hypothetical protein
MPDQPDDQDRRHPPVGGGEYPNTPGRFEPDDEAAGAADGDEHEGWAIDGSD